MFNLAQWFNHLTAYNEHAGATVHQAFIQDLMVEV